MRKLSACRQATVEIGGRRVLLLPEFELTDFPTDAPLQRREAERLLRSSDMDVVVGGFVEKSEGKLFSSCLIVDGDHVHLVRKSAPHKTEAGMIEGSGDQPKVLSLSIGRTVVFLCSDAVFCEDEQFLHECSCSGVQVVLLVSAWKHSFPKAIRLMTHFAEEVGSKHCFIIDRFNGLVRISPNQRVQTNASRR